MQAQTPDEVDADAHVFRRVLDRCGRTAVPEEFAGETACIVDSAHGTVPMRTTVADDGTVPVTPDMAKARVDVLVPAE